MGVVFGRVLRRKSAAEAASRTTLVSLLEIYIYGVWFFELDYLPAWVCDVCGDSVGQDYHYHAFLRLPSDVVYEISAARNINC